MKKYVWTITCLLVCTVALCLSAHTAKAASNGEYNYEQITGDYGSGVRLLEYLGNAQEVVIPEELDGEPVVEIGADCFAGNGTIKKVEIPDSVVCVRGFQD